VNLRPGFKTKLRFLGGFEFFENELWKVKGRGLKLGLRFLGAFQELSRSSKTGYGRFKTGV
jgi:hypothetical protein